MSGKHRAPTDTGATFSGDEDPFADAGEAPQPKGAVYDWTLREYLAHPAPSRSDLWVIWNESAYDYNWAQENGDDRSSDAMLLGSAIHLAVLEPELFLTRVDTWDRERIKAHAERLGIDAPKASVSRGGKLWDAVKSEADASGVIILTPAQYHRAKLTRDWILTRKGIRRLFQTGMAETSMVWTDPATGVELKTRQDFIAANGIIVEVKTTNDLGPLRELPWKLMRKSRELGYFVQAAGQLDGANACLDYPVTEHHTLWVRTVGAPWARLVQTPPAALAEGRGVYREAAATWKTCKETGTWPAPEFEPEMGVWEEHNA